MKERFYGHDEQFSLDEIISQCQKIIFQYIEKFQNINEEINEDITITAEGIEEIYTETYTAEEKAEEEQFFSLLLEAKNITDTQAKKIAVILPDYFAYGLNEELKKKLAEKFGYQYRTYEDFINDYHEDMPLH